MRTLRDKSIVNALRCPVCGTDMQVVENGSISLCCTGTRKHCYDLASAGYVNLCKPGQSGGGDSKQAVRARSEFLSKDYYRPVAEALCRAIEEYAKRDGLVLDAGCGEGYYSAMLASSDKSVLGIDISKFATEAAAKRVSREGRENVFFATASVFDIPVFTSAASAVTSVFAPCAENEFSRVLEVGGVLVVAWAGENHLMGLKKAIYDTAHINTERADLPEIMPKIYETRVQYDISLDNNADIMSLFSMTPYYWRTSPTDAEKLKGLHSLDTEVDIIISVYKNEKEAAE